ncbi:DUF2849 domain-containing protein [Rhodovulum sp. YNF3179]|uniref:DUF2849 domain-containing protein n=1 Tax=Rhodovulum sp. YNF3179 TaxID=3425127 RepID=UPI003D330F32
MSRPFTPQVVTANALVAGDVVYLTPGGHWSRHHAEAELIEDPDRAAARLAEAAAQTGTVVGAYLAEARPGPAGPMPVHFRERCRAQGPSNYPHGKQAETRDV